MDVLVAIVRPELTLPLRQRVLRPHQELRDAVLPGENAPDAAHLAAFADGRLVGAAVLLRERFPLMPEWADAWRLRGMATDDELRGQGIGGQVLQHVIHHVARGGGGLLWCHARLPAQRFYERNGFATIGAPWIDPHTGPHSAMWREVTVLDG